MIHWNLTGRSGGVWRRVDGKGFGRTQVCARIHVCTYCGWRSGRKRAGSTIPLSKRVRSSCAYTPLINARTTTEIPRLGFSSAGAKIYHRALLSTLRCNPVPRIASSPPPRPPHRAPRINLHPAGTITIRMTKRVGPFSCLDNGAWDMLVITRALLHIRKKNWNYGAGDVV